MARYWAGQLRRIVGAGGGERAKLEKNLLGARLLGYNDETFDLLVQILNGSSWDKDREKLTEWAQYCFNDERPDSEAESWLEDRRPVLREAALAIGSSVKGATGIRAKKKTTLRSMLAWFWLVEFHPLVIAPRFNSEGADLNGANLRDANFEGANLAGADAVEVIFLNANLANAVFANARLAFTTFQGARLEGVNLAHADLGSSRFLQTNLRHAILRAAHLVGAYFKFAYLEGADLQNANLIGATVEDVFQDESTEWPDKVVISQSGRVKVPKSEVIPNQLATIELE